MTITRTQGKQVLEYLIEHPGSDVQMAIEALDLRQLSVPEVEAAVRTVLEANPDVVAQVKSGKRSAIGYLVGQVMHETKGAADAAAVKELLQEVLP